MKKLIILAIAALCIASCGNATVVNNEPDEPQTPVWCTIGGAEEADCKQSLQTFVEQISQAGGEVRYYTIPGLNHPQTCEQSFTAERIGWVMEYSK